MKIEEKDFRIIPIDDTCLYNLELLYNVKSKSGEVKQEFGVSGYGMSLESCIKRIINYRTNKKCPETVSLKEYIEIYKSESKEIKKLLNYEETNC